MMGIGPLVQHSELIIHHLMIHSKGKGLSICSKYLPQLVVDHHVVGLYIPVHDAHTVAVVQCLVKNKTHFDTHHVPLFVMCLQTNPPTRF